MNDRERADHALDAALHSSSDWTVWIFCVRALCCALFDIANAIREYKM